MPDLWNRVFFNLRYLRQPPWDTGITPPEVQAFIRENPPGRALDLGCGTGTNVITLARTGWQVTGVDFVGRAINRARRKAQQAGVHPTFIQGDVVDLHELAEPFDLILDIGCYHSINPEQRPAYRANLNRLMALGGNYLLYGFLGDFGSERSITPGDLQALQSFLYLQNRTDSHDPNGRESTWLQYSRIKK